MSSWQAKLATHIVRKRVRPALGDMRDIPRVRRAFGHALPAPPGVQYDETTLGGVRGEWVKALAGPAEEGTPTTLLYLHGGGFVGCSPRTHRPITASLALRGLRVFVPDYRLAPEHPFPAALDDAEAVWQALHAELAASGRPYRLVVAGDSAGGNLALALMLRLRAAGRALPEAALLFSPSTDLTGQSPSLVDNAERDAMFDAQHLGNFSAAYLQGADPAQVLASPLHADLAGLPPLMVQVSRDEALRDDGVRLAHKARQAGVPVELDVLPGLPHVWPMMFRLPESRRSLDAGAHFLRSASTGQHEEALDVVILGAGLSGVGAAVHLSQRCPQHRFTLLEARDRIGGTWDLFRYPGIRSDSDMYTLGYRFKPWPNPRAIADGPSIRNYIEDTAREHGVLPHVRLGTRLVAADWNDAHACWHLTLEVGRGPQGEPGRTQTLRTRFLLMCGGYYSYAEGHRPQWAGEADFRGQLVHPQFWPEQLDYQGKRVVVIGSGATAVTLVPEMAKQAAHVTMLQRSPTYMVARPGVDGIAESLKRWLPRMWAYRLVRTKNILLGAWTFRLLRRHPGPSKQRLVGMVAEALGPGHDIARDWTPRYKPWDQRLCLVPDGDFFAAVRAGQASVVTDTIERFTPQGLQLSSGRQIEADVVVAATGLKLNVMADVQFSRGGQPIDFAKTFNYKGTMYSGVPNLINTFGYTNASWTLKADLTCDYLCKLLTHMRRRGLAVAEPKADPALQAEPFLEFTSGYVQRAVSLMPKQGARLPWRIYQNYLRDLVMLRWGKLDDGVLLLRAAPRPPTR